MSNLAYVRKLGSGQYGEVWLAEDMGLNARRAVKLIPKNSLGDVSAYSEEARILYSIKHANVVEVYATDYGPDRGDSPAVGMYEIVMEYMDGGSLEANLKVRDFSVVNSIRIIADACRGLERVHSLNYLHRDIKPGNILMNERHTKLSDFGLSTLAYAGVGSGAGTFEFMAPESISIGNCSVSSDVYSLGVTFYQLINGEHSLDFTGSDDKLRTAILKGAFPNRKQYRASVTAGLRRVINRAINADASKRFTTASSFLHAIESVRVKCDWQIEERGDSEVWIGTCSGKFLKLFVDRNKLQIELSRCPTRNGTFRRVTAECKKVGDVAELEKHRDAVLEKLTITGLRKDE